MKRILFILLVCITGTQLYAFEIASFSDFVESPTMTMQSVNSTEYMSNGSAYSSIVYAVGSSSPSRAGVRKAPPSVGTEVTEGGYDPNNPQFAPIGDALFPLLIIASAFAVFTYFRRRRLLRTL